MEFATPLGLIAFLSVPAVLVLHLYRRQLREKKVSALFLFRQDALPADAGRQRSRLLRTPSLWLELLAALLLSLWLSGFAAGLSDRRTHLVILLDDSASMQAVSAVSAESGGSGGSTGSAGPGGEGNDNKTRSCAERARERVQRIVSETANGSVCTLILTGKRTRILLGPRAPLHLLQEQLEAWQPGGPEHDFLPALELGLEIAEPQDQLLFFTDHRVDAPPRYRVLAFGKAAPNAAIVSASRERAGDREKLNLVLNCWAAQPQETELSVLLGEERRQEQIYSKKIRIQPGQLSPVSLSFPKTTQPWTVQLGRDALAVDNSVRLLPRVPKPVLLATAMPEEVQGRMGLKRLAQVLPEVSLVPVGSKSHILLAPAPSQVHEDTTQLLIQAPGSKRDHWIGPFLMERRHPLLSGISLDGVVFTAGRGELLGLPLILAGEQTLLSEEQPTNTAPRLHLNLDVKKTNIFDTPDWPILVSNLVERVRRTLPGPSQVNLRVGDEILYRLPRSEVSATAHLIDPEGVSREGRGRGVLSWEARVPGEHRLLQDQRMIARYSVQFVDAHESDLQAHRSFEQDPRERERGPVAMQASGYMEARILAFLLFCCMVLDWLVLRRQR